MNLEEIKERILCEKTLDKSDSWYHPQRLSLLPRKTLENIEYCINECVKNNIDGDYIECGVWKGGSVIYANEIFKSLNEERKIYVADSFKGLPPPSLPQDSGDIHHTITQLSVSVEEVKNNFLLFGELTDNIIFLEGWFKDTLPSCPSEKYCIIRADGDMYESTMDILNNLYSKLSVGGFCIIDDYGHKGCIEAVNEFRKTHNITDEIILIDDTPGAYPSVYWKKTN